MTAIIGVLSQPEIMAVEVLNLTVPDQWPQRFYLRLLLGLLAGRRLLRGVPIQKHEPSDASKPGDFTVPKDVHV